MNKLNPDAITVSVVLIGLFLGFVGLVINMARTARHTKKMVKLLEDWKKIQQPLPPGFHHWKDQE